MSASAFPPTASTTLVIVLGASAWPNGSEFQASQAFVNAARGFRDYMLDPHGFGLPAANLLDLFDAVTSASDQLEMLGSFLEEQTMAQKAKNQAIQDVLIYFVGHGAFAGSSADLFLLPRRANARSLRASGLSIEALAEVLREKARLMRRYLFLDCCFAAAAFRSFQGGPDQTAIQKTLDAFAVRTRGSGFPRKGTALFCSSDQKSPSLLLPDESSTMFSSALLNILRKGDHYRPPQLSLYDIKELMEDLLATWSENNAPRPIVLSPDQSDGDVASVPFFPNLRVKEEHPQVKDAEQVQFAKKRHAVKDTEHLLSTASLSDIVHYTNARVVLVGDSGVGKSGLALVLSGQSFAPTDSTHGRHVWLLDQQVIQQDGGPHEMRDVLLWDLAGQPDYRLIHQLHLHEATVALIVFDAARDTDPFAGIRHWYRAVWQALQAHSSTAFPFKIFLVAARIDRGGRSVSRIRIAELMQELGCRDYFETSAKDGRGIAELSQEIRTAIDWTKLPKVTSTILLQSIKMFVSQQQQAGRLVQTVDDLYETFLLSSDVSSQQNSSRQQFETALGRLETQGTLRLLGFGNLVLLQPERLDAYASALLIAAKDEPDGLGSISEIRVQQGLFSIPAEDRLTHLVQEKLLIIAMIDELVRHQLVLRESGLLLFPSQSTRNYPGRALLENKSSVIFIFTGPILSVYTTLVVRLAQCGFFQKQDLWQHVVTYTSWLGGTFGILLSPQSEERAELSLFFDEAAGEEMRFHFEDFVFRHLELYTSEEIQRRRRFVCPDCGEAFTETQVSNRRARGFTFMHCSTCEAEISLLDRKERLALPPQSLARAMERTANDQRDRESALSLLPGKIATQDFDVFLCHHGQDKGVIKHLGEQLKQLGILPWLDEWELRPGLPWQRLLEQQIAQIRAAAVFVGKDGIGPWQHQELDAFLREFARRGCPVIPVLLADAPLEPALPVFLKAMTWVDFRAQTPDPMQQLIWGITGKRDVLGQNSINT